MPRDEKNSTASWVLGDEETAHEIFFARLHAARPLPPRRWAR
jgi:hypothetical protein